MSSDVQYLLQKLPPYEGKARMVKRRQDTYDIIREVLGKHSRTTAHYDQIAKDHWGGTPAATAENLYRFLHRDVPYKVEKTLYQTVKSPAAILAERLSFGNDCKHYASYIVGVGEALRRAGYPVKCFYRFASYNKNTRSPGHVFGVFVVNGKEIWIDPVPEIGGFNRRAVQPCYVTDKMPPMSVNGNRIGSLYDISGLPSNRYVAGLRPNMYVAGVHWLDTLPTSHDNGLGKAKKKKKHHKGLHIKIKPGKIFAKFGLSTSRNAYGLLLKLNVFDMAVKIWKKAAHDKSSANWKKLAAHWEKLGGKPDKLYTWIKQGVNTHNKLHKSKKVSGAYMDEMNGLYDMDMSGIDDMSGMDDIGYYHEDMSIGDVLRFVHGSHHSHRMRREPSIGVAQVAVAAGVIAAAAPIIKALAGILKSFGVNTDKASEAGEADTTALAEEHNKSEGGADGDGGATHDTGVETKVKNNADGSQELAVKNIPGLSDQDDKSGGGSSSGGSGGGGGGAASDEDGGADDEKSVTKAGGKGGAVATALHSVTAFISDHKTWFIVGGVITLAIFIGVKVFKHKKGR